MRGTFIAIVGPSGAGKDTVMNGARAALKDAAHLVFARRVVTRDSGSNEDHDTLSRAAFEAQVKAGGFLIWWDANDLLYGLPASLEDDLAAGRHVIANVSRGMISAIRATMKRNLVVTITARPEILAERLAGRGREDEAMRSQRLARGLRQQANIDADLTIENNGVAQTAIDTLVAILISLPIPVSAQAEVEA